MKLLIIRHGQASPLSEKGDTHRHLTDTGRRELLRQLRILKKLGLQIDKLVTSPLLRARQTTKALRKKFLVRGKIEVWEELSPDTEVKTLIDKLKNEPTDGLIALVGHNPILSHVACRLLYFKPDSLVLNPAGIALLEIPSIQSETPAELLLWLNPAS